MSITPRKLALSGLFLGLCLALPFLTMQIPQIGSALLPMHLPVLVAGFVLGAPYAGVIGFIAPLLRYALFGMPPIFPTGVAMAFELAAYGCISGLMYKRLPRRSELIYVSLITAMLGGRVVWGLVRFALSGLSGSAFTFPMFLAGAFTSAVPGIILQIALVPVVVIALKHAKLTAYA